VDGDLIEKPKTARSYRGTMVSDNAIISINVKWLGQMLILVAGLVYSYTEITQSIADNSRRTFELEQRVDDLAAIHDAEIKEIQSWYKEINLNPFSKKKRK
tara:strand:+ start:476 stop:778 length:303 start_codon:yes stop_codon:yes gene_type:complete